MSSPSPYTIIEPLCHGRGTDLYRAIRDADRCPVILKVLDPRRSRPKDLEQLKREYEIGRLFDTPAVVRPLALETYQGMPALVLEDFGGDSLDGLLDAPMGIERFLPIAIGIAGAVAEVHEKGVTHKDLKPHNILVSLSSGEVKIADFGLASRLPREHQPPQAARLVEGSLPYLAPEQTGRTNRAIDSRADLYSLGVTFHQMLTGRLPFEAKDPVEWVHCHIARAPPKASEIVPEVPETVARIVLKLLSKAPEDRYQTAFGLRLDLERCLTEWSRSGTIEPFTPGEHDVSDRLQIPQKLYGRDAEIALLREAFGRVVVTGAPELVLVSGYSGIGKSALVHELEVPVVRERGFFISGKFDQYKRDIPYATLVQAFRELVLWILAESEEQIAAWRQLLLGVLGINAQLIMDVIPEIALIIGPQPPAPELPPVEAQNRFRMVFRRFIGVFARREHPLALFLDDLQWTDAASLGLLEDLLAHAEVCHLLVIGAYRDNEVSPSHPLMLTLDEVRKAGARVSDIVLGPIPREDLAAFIGDALRCRREEAEPLADLVCEKTAGNPFFAIQFLTALYEEGQIELDRQSGGFRWDLAKIHAKRFTDNVVDLMVGKVRRLPAAAQEALRLLACLGNTVEAAVLAMVHGRAEEDVHAELWEAVRTGLVLRLGDTYKFVHDRIQEAAYSQIPQDRRAAEHLRIGRLLLAHGLSASGEDVFDIVNHFNRGSALLESQDEKSRVAGLNLAAARKAKAATAYASALGYLSAGQALLSLDSWETQYDVTYGLHIERAQCEWLCGHFERAADLLAVLMARARSRADRVAVYRIKIELHTTRGEIEQSALATLEACSQVFDLELPLHPTREELRRTARRVRKELGARAIEDLIHLPTMTDPDMRAEVAMLSASLPSAYQLDSNLSDAICCEIVSLSLGHGNTSGSPHGYVSFGAMLGRTFEEWGEANRFGKLAYDLVEKPGFTGSKASTYFTIGILIDTWIRHVRDVPRLLHKALQSAIEQGDCNHACYAVCAILVYRVIMGDPLAEVATEAEKYLDFARQAKCDAAHDTIVGIYRLVKTLREGSPDPSSYDAPGADQVQLITGLTVARGFVHPGLYYTCKAAAQFMFLNLGEAVAASLRAREFNVMGWAPEAECYYWTALTLAAHYDHATLDRQREYLATLAAYQEQFRVWQKHCPQTFLNRYALLSAEIARIEGRDLDAMRQYEEAIRSARENGFVQNEALSYELASRFYRARGFDQFADTYLRDARSRYARWGADGKVKQIDQQHPHLVEPRLLAPTATFAVRTEQLDIYSVTKASQTISGEIVLDKLVRTLLEIVLEQGGAQRACLIVCRDKSLSIEAEAVLEERGAATSSLGSEVVGSSSRVPASLVQYVQRTKERVILSDAGADAGKFSGDDYFARRRPRSVLCMPIRRQAEVVGLLYLENNLLAGAFTPDRLAALELLATQAAISLENALLVELEQQKAALSAHVVHDLKSPASAIMLAASLRLRTEGLSAADRRAWSTALSSAGHIHRTALNLLDIAGSREGKLTPKPAEIDLGALFGEVRELFLPQAEKREQAIELCCDVPPGILRADMDLLRRILQNLVDNALRHSPPRGTVRLEARASSAWVEVCVCDDGPGVPAHLRDRIFDRYVRLAGGGDEAATRHGLGLTFCRLAVEAHGGTIGVQDNEPRGSRFCCRLPVAARSAP